MPTITPIYFPTRRRITDEDIQLILTQDLDDEFMDDISSDAGSASGSDDGDTASGHIFECGCE